MTMYDQSEMVMIGNHAFVVCRYCRKMVKISGFWKGNHLCLTDEEKAAADHSPAGEEG